MNPYRLYLVTDEHQDIKTLRQMVTEAVKGGVTMVQVREKHGDVRAFIRRASVVREALTDSGIPLIINDRVDVALAVEADGIHLGQTDMDAETARRLAGDRMIIGLSVENERQLRQAQDLPIDYLGLSAIFATPTKTNTITHWGIEGLREAVKQSKLPIVAIGGINSGNISEVAQTGTAGIALVSAIAHADNPKHAAEHLRRLIG